MASTTKQTKQGPMARLTSVGGRIRRRVPLIDHGVRMVQHYGQAQGSVLAGAVTYFGFLSFFPVLALAFAAVGYVVAVFPDARVTVTDALESVFPGLVGEDPGDPIKVSAFENAKGAAGVVGALGLLYSGLGWLSGLRASLQAMFGAPAEDKRNFVVGKLLDLVVLVVIGLTLMASVAVSGAVTAFTDDLLEALALAEEARVLVAVVGVVLGILASTVLFFTMFAILPKHRPPRRALLHGALLAAIGFEVLKVLASLLMTLVTNRPAFAVLGVSLVLLVWIYYFSRVTLYGAAWAVTDPVARAATTEPEGAAAAAPSSAAVVSGDRTRVSVERRARRESFAAGAAIGAVIAAVAAAFRRPRR